MAELRHKAPRVIAPKLRAQYVTQIFECLNARPPGVLASLALLAVHIGSFVGAAWIMIYFALNPMELFHHEFDIATQKPPHVYAQGQTQIARGDKYTALDENARVTVMSTFPTDLEAEQAFAKLVGDVPGQAALRRFGKHLILTLPKDAQEARASWPVS